MRSLLLACFSADFGSLWWVREDLWMEVLSRYDASSTRKAHPGLSIRRTPVQSLYDLVPMMHGSTGKRGPIVVRRLTKCEAEGHACSFRFLRPGLIPVHEFVVPADEGGRKTTRVWPNRHKPRLDPEEMEQLEAWIAERPAFQ